jgi:tRNA uridine 5-carboxymethylaminomethyl modification enzyme gidA
MSIFFTQVISALLGFVLFAALNHNSKNLKVIFLPSFIGIVVGILIFKLARFALLDHSVKLVFDAITTGFLALAIIFIFVNSNYAKMIIFLVLGSGFGFTYSYTSANFPIFSGDLLDTQSIISLFLMIFAFLLLLWEYFLVANLKKSQCKHVILSVIVIVLLVLLLQMLSSTTLEFMRSGLVKTQSFVLSLIAKGIYYTTFSQYFFVAVIVILAVLNLIKIPKKLFKSEVGSNAFRFNKAIRSDMLRQSKNTIFIAVIITIFGLYYDLYASRPPVISTPIIIEPKNGKFVFDANMLNDNELHRYAFISDEGKEIRFFLLNRFPDRLSPTVVFDACAICGDMGYVKKGNDLICISCNVRIFLPSVGRDGGCNPIPIKYEFDGKNITVMLSDVVSGMNYFSKVVEKMIPDPVSRKMVSNLTSKSYLYFNKLYFFENEKTQAEFEANPQKYVDENGTLK